MKKIKLLRDYGKLKKGDVIELKSNEADFLLLNQFACVDIPIDAGCEDCKSSKVKKPTTKKSKISKTSVTKK